MKKKMISDVAIKILTGKVFLIVLFLLIFMNVPIITSYSESTTYHGCYDANSESFRFVEDIKECRENENLVTFSEQMLIKQKDIQKYDLDDLIKCVEKNEKRRTKCVKICPRDARYCVWYCCDTDGRGCRIDRVVTW